MSVVGVVHKKSFSVVYHSFEVGSGPSNRPPPPPPRVPLLPRRALEKELLTGLHWIGHKHCISVIGWTELIHAGGSLSACLLPLTNLRGKIGIQLVWPEELSLPRSLMFVIQSLGPLSNSLSLAILTMIFFLSPLLFSRSPPVSVGVSL